MKPRFFFKDHGHVIRTRSGIEWGWGLAAGLLMVLLLGLAHRSDERAEIDLQVSGAAHDAGFQAGRLAGHEDAMEQMAKRMTEAYEAGLQDGLYAVRGKPEGLALAQACGALRVAQSGGRP